MPVPAFDMLTLPVLRHSAEKTLHIQELTTRIANEFGLTEEERNELPPGRRETTIRGRVSWAATYLKHAGLLERPKRGFICITPRGRDVLAENPTKIDVAFLRQFDDFAKWQASPNRSRKPWISLADAAPAPEGQTPEDQIATASSALEDALREALLARLCEASPAFFEKAIIELLLAMGYGGSTEASSEHLGKSGDGGVDGVIREDQLGLDQIYLQAKRYQPGHSVGPELVHAFIGALMNHGATKGVLITTSAFTQSARNAAQHPGALHVILIDGNELTKLMVRFNVGVRLSRTVEIKRIDPDYFEPPELE
ncbi:MAG: restriction endonuclease [Acetobacteraceae bacterium]